MFAGVVDNTLYQKPNADMKDFVDALNYYYKYDTIRSWIFNFFTEEDDFNEKTGKTTIQLVRTNGEHRVPHKGSVPQVEKIFNVN